MKKSVIISLFAVIAIAALSWWLLGKGEGSSADGAEQSVAVEDCEVEVESNGDAETPGTAEADAEDPVEADDKESPTELTEEETEQKEDRLVDEFDAETDHWMDTESSKPPTMDEIETYRVKFKRLPKSRKEECLQRALNLVSDDNVMVLTGILMDKSEDKELVTMIYNDILNRDEMVKKPILQIIYQDKDHSCWADTAWILDVTGELPEKK